MANEIKKYCEGLDCAICDEKEPCIYKIANDLQEQLLRKEQECEELKKIINEAKNSKLDLNSFFAIEATVGEYQLELDRLKAENDELKEEKQGLIKDWEEKKNLAYEIACKNEQLSKTLTEIKEIAENSINCSYELSSVINEMYEIKEKISEVE